MLIGWLSRRKPWGRGAAAAFLALMAGALSLATRLDSATFASLPEHALTLEGTVVGTSPGLNRARVDLDDVVAIDNVGPLPRGVRLYEDTTPSGQRALWRSRPGERIRARVRLRAPRDIQNPGSHSSAQRARRAGVGALGSLLHPMLYATLPEHAAFAPGAVVREFRSEISQRLRKSGSGSELVRALALGDRTDLSAPVREAFRRLGLSHLLAVSGLHLSLVASLFYAALRVSLGRSAWLAARRDTRRVALVGGVIGATFYALLAGWGVPVRRALVLLLALLLAVIRRRHVVRAEPLSAAAILVLAIEPAALFDPGAQLSFAAAWGLAFAAPRSAGARTGRLRSQLEDATRASASAVVTTAPIAAWQLATVAPIGVFANLLGIPWTAVVLLPAALLSAMTAAAGIEPLASFCAAIASGIASATLELVVASANGLPALSPTTEPGVGWKLVVLMLVVIVLRLKRTATRLLGALIVSVMLVALPPAPITPLPPRLVALEVGQGTANIIQGRQAAILVDAGAVRGAKDWGRSAVVPALAALGVEHLDLLVVSHGDLDHRGGVPSVLDALPVGEVWIPFGAAADPAFGSILTAAKTRGVTVSERGAGAAGVLIGDLKVTALWPERGMGRRSRNDRSLVVRVEVEGLSVLLPGDISASAELDLLHSGAGLHAEVLSLPHHGSRSSSSASFLGAVGASVGIASAPPAGRFDMPHPEVLVRARSAGVSVWWTGRDGAVLVGLGRPLTVWGYRDPGSRRDRNLGVP